MTPGHPFRKGLAAGIPVALGYLPIAVAFGILARSSGIPPWVGMASSLIVFAGAAQFVGIRMMALAASPLEIILTTALLNLRHVLMASAIAPRIERGTRRSRLLVLAFGLTDETFAVASTRPEATFPASFHIGLNTAAWTAWNLGTAVGLLLAGGLPPIVERNMGISLYLMFVALLVPCTRTARSMLWVAILAVGVNLLLSAIPALAGSEALRPLLATILSAFLGTLLFGRSPDPAACPQPAATGPDGEAAPGSAAERGDS